MRTLKFGHDDVSKTRFEIVFHGLFIEGNRNDRKGLSVLRTEINLLDKIESISHPCECGKTVMGTKESDRELNEDEQTMQIDDNEFDLLYDYISRVPWSIGKSSRDALRTLDWLKNPYDGSPS